MFLSTQVLNYFLQANLYLVLFFLAYRLFLVQDTFLRRNRYYLLGSVLVALALPALSLLDFTPAELLPNVTESAQLAPVGELVRRWNGTANTEVEASYPAWVWGYGAVSLILMGRFVYALSGLLYLVAKRGVRRQDRVWVVPLPEGQEPFSFCCFLFWSEEEEWTEDDRKHIWEHEQAHIRQGHSMEIILFELLHIVFWVNPVCVFYKQAIRQVHEYLADEAATQKVADKSVYASLLLGQFLGTSPISLSNYFMDKQFLKRRIMMLNQSPSRSKAKYKLLFLIPVICLGIFMQACGDQVISEEAENTIKPAPSEKDKKKADDEYYAKMELVKTVDLDDPSISTFQIEGDSTKNILMRITGPTEKPQQGYRVDVYKEDGKMAASNLYQNTYFANYAYKCRKAQAYTVKIVERPETPKGSKAHFYFQH